ncbi:hypothetical protein KR009_011595, partial [Drosophila setifemur]
MSDDIMDQFVVGLSLFIVLIILLYRWSIAKYNVFRDRNVAHDKPRPLLGNVPLKGMVGRWPVLKHMIALHLRYEGCPVYGVYALREPTFFIRDPELIRLVCVKKFDHFVNHPKWHNNVEDSIFSKSLMSLRDARWREMRNILSPAFTNTMIRAMYNLIHSCSEKGVAYIDEQKELPLGIDLEMKDYFTRFANDVIATVAFGVSINSFRRKDNEFFRIGQSLSKISVWMVVKSVFYALFPRLSKILRIQILDTTNIYYFSSLVNVAMRYRQEHNVIRPDMIHLLMEAKQQRHDQLMDQSKDSRHIVEITDEDLWAQCLLFFFAGFEFMSSSLCFLTYELCLNPEVQQRLYEEILLEHRSFKGQPLTYDRLMRMKYMDMVVLEGLRKWPPALSSDRECCKDVDLCDERGEKLFSARQGDVLQIPIFAMHHDPQSFPNPESFDPERFSAERIGDIKPCSYLPFGVGPRNCIGNRMALMEIKSMLYQMLLNIELLPSAKTTPNMLEAITGHGMKPKDGFWLKLRP